jgi:hypothetical protein
MRSARLRCKFAFQFSRGLVYVYYSVLSRSSASSFFQIVRIHRRRQHAWAFLLLQARVQTHQDADRPQRCSQGVDPHNGPICCWYRFERRTPQGEQSLQDVSLFPFPIFSLVVLSSISHHFLLSHPSHQHTSPRQHAPLRNMVLLLAPCTIPDPRARSERVLTISGSAPRWNRVLPAPFGAEQQSLAVRSEGVRLHSLISSLRTPRFLLCPPFESLTSRKWPRDSTTACMSEHTSGPSSTSMNAPLPD